MSIDPMTVLILFVGVAIFIMRHITG